MKVRILATAAIAATALALSAAAPALATAPAKPTGTMTVYSHSTQRNVLDIDASGGITIGDVVTGSGTVATTKGGKSVGTFAYRAETVRVNMPGGNENRISTSVYSLPGGTILLSGLVSVQQGTRPTKTEPVVIVGGTGKYAGAAGTATLNPGSTDNYKVTFKFTS